MEAKGERKTFKLGELAIHNVERKVMTASRVCDVIQDYRTLQRETNSDAAGKQKRIEAEPPNTLNHWQQTAYRHLSMLEERLRKEFEECNGTDLAMQQRLEETMKKSSDLAEEFQQAELAYCSLLKEKESHSEFLDKFNKDAEMYAKTAKRFVKCGSVLEKIRLMIETVIEKNKCYPDFIKSLAGSRVSITEAGYSLTEFIAEFEKIEKTKNIITGQMDAVLAKAEKSQFAVTHVKNDFIRELKFAVERLISSVAATTKSTTKNERYENALNIVGVEAIETMKSLANVLSSAEQMVENLIASKAVDHSYRKKTLAQQFEAVREDYVKKKAILHEYQKARAKRNKKMTCMLQAFEDGQLLEEQMALQEVRLKDLAKKKVKMGMIRRQNAELKRLKRIQGYEMSSRALGSEQEYNPLEDSVAVLDLEDDRPIKMGGLTDTDEYEETSDSDEEEEEDDHLTAYSGTTKDSIFGVESNEQLASFMMAVESEAEVEMAPSKRSKSKRNTKKQDSGNNLPESSAVSWDPSVKFQEPTPSVSLREQQQLDKMQSVSSASSVSLDPSDVNMSTSVSHIL